MTLGWPQAIYLSIMFVSICMHASKNGQPYKHGYDLGARLFSAALSLSLLYWGGFFA